jgi:SAM-dependent methyltransferase
MQVSSKADSAGTVAVEESVGDPQPLKFTHPYKQWKKHSLRFERKWWEDHPPPSPDGARETSKKMMERLGFNRDSFADQTVIDVGHGPTGRLNWLNVGTLIGIDPLTNSYRTIGGSRIEAYDRLFVAEAEKRIHELEGVADAVVSINCLDHGYDFCAAILSIRSYLKPAGMFFLSMGVDIPFPADDGHPLRLTNVFVTDFLNTVGLQVYRIDRGRCYPCADGTWDDTYSGGPAYHWWCRRVE